MGDLLQPWHLMLIGAILVFPTIFLGVIPFWFICRKAGFSPFLSLLNLIPFCMGTLVLVYFLAFAPWKPAGQPHPAGSPQS
jgi:hypothetical protein